jgi:putative membrane protein
MTTKDAAPGTGDTLDPQPENVSETLAVERTRMAYDRTLMAWVRTAISLISFGFTIYKFFQIETRDSPLSNNFANSSVVSALMIVIGLVSLLMGTREHHEGLKHLRAQHTGIPRSYARVLALLISGLGIVALASVILRI